MPCTGGGPSREQIEREREDQARLIRTACEAMKFIEARGLLAEMSEEARYWYEAHQQRDADDRRRRKFMRERERKALLEERERIEKKLRQY